MFVKTVIDFLVGCEKGENSTEADKQIYHDTIPHFATFRIFYEIPTKTTLKVDSVMDHTIESSLTQYLWLNARYFFEICGIFPLS